MNIGIASYTDQIVEQSDLNNNNYNDNYSNDHDASTFRKMNTAEFEKIEPHKQSLSDQQSIADENEGVTPKIQFERNDSPVVDIDFLKNPEKIANPFIRALVIASQKSKKENAGSSNNTNIHSNQESKFHTSQRNYPLTTSNARRQDHGIKLIKIKSQLGSTPQSPPLEKGQGSKQEQRVVFNTTQIDQRESQVTSQANEVHTGLFSNLFGQGASSGQANSALKMRSQDSGSPVNALANNLFSRLTKLKTRISKKIDFIHKLPLEQQLNWKYNIEKCQFMKDREYESKYFENMKVQPGLKFFDFLSLCDLESLKLLDILIPHTLCIFSTSSWLFNNPEGKGLQHKNDFTLKNFHNKVVEQRHLRSGTTLQREGEPVAIMRTRSKLNQFKADKSVMSWHKFHDMVEFGIESNSVLQEFIPTYHTKTPSLIRFAYYNPKHQQVSHKNQAFLLQNRDSVEEYHHNLTHKQAICFDNIYSFDICQLKSNMYPELEWYSRNLLSFLEHMQRGVQVTMLVVDFIKTHNPSYKPKMPHTKHTNFLSLKSSNAMEKEKEYLLYFTNLYVYRYKDTVSIQRPMTLEEEGERHRRLAEVKVKFMTCRLCKEPHQRLEMSKIIPMQMIYQYICHLRKRGIYLFERQEQKYKNSVQQCKVCDDCYKMILAEYQLIQAEKKLAKYMAVVQSDTNKDYQMHTSLFEQKPIVLHQQENYQQKEYVQWRAMIYVEELNDFNVSQLMECDSFYLQIKMFNQVCVFKVENTIKVVHHVLRKHTTLITNERRAPILKPPRLSQITKPLQDKIKLLTPATPSLPKLNRQETLDVDLQRTLPVKKAKMFYFFTEKNSNYKDMLRPFFANAKFEINLQKEVVQQEIIATGSCFPIQAYSKNVDESPNQISTCNVFCFTKLAKSGEIFSAKVKFGVQRDKEVRFEEPVRAWEISGGAGPGSEDSLGSIFFPVNEYFSSDPLPSDWVGLISDKTVIDRQETQDNFFSSSVKLGAALKDKSFNNSYRKTKDNRLSSSLDRRQATHSNAIKGKAQLISIKEESPKVRRRRNKSQDRGKGSDDEGDSDYDKASSLNADLKNLDYEERNKEQGQIDEDQEVREKDELGFSEEEDISQILHDMNNGGGTEGDFERDIDRLIARIDRQSEDLIKRFKKSQQPQKTVKKLKKDKTARQRASNYRRILNEGGQTSPLFRNGQSRLAQNLKDLARRHLQSQMRDHTIRTVAKKKSTILNVAFQQTLSANRESRSVDYSQRSAKNRLSQSFRNREQSIDEFTEERIERFSKDDRGEGGFSQELNIFKRNSEDLQKISGARNSASNPLVQKVIKGRKSLFIPPSPQKSFQLLNLEPESQGNIPPLHHITPNFLDQKTRNKSITQATIDNFVLRVRPTNSSREASTSNSRSVISQSILKTYQTPYLNNQKPSMIPSQIASKILISQDSNIHQSEGQIVSNLDQNKAISYIKQSYISVDVTNKSSSIKEGESQPESNYPQVQNYQTEETDPLYFNILNSQEAKDSAEMNSYQDNYTAIPYQDFTKQAVPCLLPKALHQLQNNKSYSKIIENRFTTLQLSDLEVKQYNRKVYLLNQAEKQAQNKLRLKYNHLVSQQLRSQSEQQRQKAEKNIISNLSQPNLKSSQISQELEQLLPQIDSARARLDKQTLHQERIQPLYSQDTEHQDFNIANDPSPHNELANDPKIFKPQESLSQTLKDKQNDRVTLSNQIDKVGLSKENQEDNQQLKRALTSSTQDDSTRQKVSERELQRIKMAEILVKRPPKPRAQRRDRDLDHYRQTNDNTQAITMAQSKLAQTLKSQAKINKERPINIAIHQDSNTQQQLNLSGLGPTTGCKYDIHTLNNTLTNCNSSSQFLPLLNPSCNISQTSQAEVQKNESIGKVYVSAKHIKRKIKQEIDRRRNYQGTLTPTISRSTDQRLFKHNFGGELLGKSQQYI